MNDTAAPSTPVPAAQTVSNAVGAAAHTLNVASDNNRKKSAHGVVLRFLEHLLAEGEGDVKDAAEKLKALVEKAV